MSSDKPEEDHGNMDCFVMPGGWVFTCSVCGFQVGLIMTPEGITQTVLHPGNNAAYHHGASPGMRVDAVQINDMDDREFWEGKINQMGLFE